MRKMRERPSGKDKDVLVAEFVLNRDEAGIIHSLLTKAEIYLPKQILNEGTLERIRNMKNVLGHYLSQDL